MKTNNIKLLPLSFLFYLVDIFLLARAVGTWSWFLVPSMLALGLVPGLFCVSVVKQQKP